jgi:hypothetical protein
MESKGRGVLDTPACAGYEGFGAQAAQIGERAPDARIFSQFRHFPFSPKRFMVPRGFATGKISLSINVKGLAGAQDLWRAV